MRSGYSDSCEGWELIRWRGAVASAIRGKRGQAFLRDLLTALDALPEKRLIAEDLEKDGEVCALGAVGRFNNPHAMRFSPDDHLGLADAFNIPRALVQEIEFINDETWDEGPITPERRFEIVRKWAVANIKTEARGEHHV